MNHLTFDIEEWYLAGHKRQVPVVLWPKMESRVMNNTIRILDILRMHQVKAHFFVMGWVAEQHPALVEAILKDGHQLGYHSWWHQEVSQLSEDEFEADLVKGLDFLRKLTGNPIDTYRAPYFSMTEWAGDNYKILMKHGIKLSSSIKNSRDYMGMKMNNAPFWIQSGENRLLEMPLNTHSILGVPLVFSGSGYFRLLPTACIANLFRKYEYNMSYFHPRDLDYNASYSSHVSHFRYLVNRIGTKGIHQKFNHLLKEIRFEPLDSALEKYKNSPILKID
jgi:peptidoglycan-N-acetylglucosamine deacetylase